MTKIKLNELVEMLSNQDDNVVIEVDQPNPFQLVITLSK